MRLTPQQARDLADALRGAFPDESALGAIVPADLAERLRTSGPGEDRRPFADRLVNEAERHEDWTARLIGAARDAKPSDPKVLALARQVGLAPTLPATPALERTVDEGSAFHDAPTWTSGLGEILPRVCRVDVRGTSEGTGFLVGPDLILTNFHVVEQVLTGHGAGPADVKLVFDHKRLPGGKIIDEGVSYRLRLPDWLVDRSPYSAFDRLPDPKPGDPAPDELDYALLRLDGAPGRDPVGGSVASGAPARGWFDLPAGVPLPLANAVLFIVQHPRGRPLELAYGTVIGVNTNETRLTYRTSTDPGSSGSPCFTGAWTLVALHHSGDPAAKATFNGQYNQGIPIGAIGRRLRRPELAGRLDLSEQFRTARAKAPPDSALPATAEAWQAARHPPAGLAGPSLPSGTVAFLFTDVEGSTRRWQRHGAAMGAAVARHDALMRAAIEAHGGRVFKTVGDAFCAAFSTAPPALAAALAGQRALAAEDMGAAGPLRVRMALHAGAAEEREADYFGPAVNRVARLLAAGHGGQVLLSQAAEQLMHDALPAGVALRDLGEHRLKDLDRPERVFQVVAPGLPSDFPPINTLGRTPHNLPAQPPPFVGRAREVAEVKELLARPDHPAGTRLVTLIGPGGVGKTRLALAVAADLADGDAFERVVFGDLAGVADPDLVAAELARALDAPESADQTIEDDLIAHLCHRRYLLVLDTFERVLAARSLVDRLVAGCPELSVLVTSRAALELPAEQRYRVKPLALPNERRKWSPREAAAVPAVELFVARAQAIDHAFALDDANAGAVVEICRRLGGLPLAIELAAARIDGYAPQEILTDLEDELLRMQHLEGVAPRHRGLLAAFGWTYDRLEEREQALFRELAVFAGGFTRETAQALAGGTRVSVAAGIATLVDQSLLRRDEGPDRLSRFVMLDPIREFGLEKLGDEAAAEAQGRHAAFFAALAESIEPALLSPGQGTSLDRLEAEHDNLRAALAWTLETGDGATAMRLVAALWRFWQDRGYQSEGRTWLERTLTAEPTATTARAKALYGLGCLAIDLGDYPRAKGCFEQSLALRRAQGDPLGIAEALNGLGMVAADVGENDEARDLHEQALAIRVAEGDEQGQAKSRYNLGFLARDAGDYKTARARFEESLAVWRRLGDPSGTAYRIFNLGIVARLQNRWDQAEALFLESLGLFRTLGNTLGIGTVLTELGGSASRRHDAVEAVELYAEALDYVEGLGVTVETVQCVEGLAAVAGARAMPAQAARLLGWAAAQRRIRNLPFSPPADELSHNRSVAKLRRADRPAWDAAVKAGEAMTLEQAVSEARAVAASIAEGAGDRLNRRSAATA